LKLQLFIKAIVASEVNVGYRLVPSQRSNQVYGLVLDHLFAKLVVSQVHDSDVIVEFQGFHHAAKEEWTQPILIKVKLFQPLHLLSMSDFCAFSLLGRHLLPSEASFPFQIVSVLHLI